MSDVPSGYTDADVARWVNEPPKSATRTDFVRDRARIVHSSALRRLGQKTQVLGAGSGDFVRTRLTHSLEVAQVARELGAALGCDPDVVDAAGLAHDLGHPPFGHNGERALDAIAADIGGFEGNAQTLRILTRLEPKSIHPETGAAVGLNLTRAILDASTKYPWPEDKAPLLKDGSSSRKFGVYADDLPVFEWMRAGAPVGRPSFEAQVMDLADDVAYSVHDVEDAVVHKDVPLKRLDDRGEARAVIAGALQWYGRATEDELLAALDRLRAQPYWMTDYDGSHAALAGLKNFTSQLIGRFCNAAIAATRESEGHRDLTRYNGALVVPLEVRHEILVLKGIAIHYLMRPRHLNPKYSQQRERLQELVWAIVERGDDALEPHFAPYWRAAGSDAERLRVAIDQVAALTDTTAYQWHHKYCIED